MPTQSAILGGNLRLGNFRLGYVPAYLATARQTRIQIQIAGVDARTRVRLADVSIHDILNDAPNLCNLTIDGSAPSVGQTVRVTINVDAPTLLFSGTLQSTDLTYEGRPVNTAWPSVAIDDTGRANRRRPFGTWTSVSATTIAQYLVATFAPGYTATHVQASLPAISISFDGSDSLNGALQRIVTPIGGYFYWEDADLHLFQTEATNVPDTLDSTPGRFLDDPPIRITSDDSQLRTRVYGKGAGAATLIDIGITETIVPIANAYATPFNAAGGKVIHDTQILTYTGTQIGNALGMMTSAIAGPPSAPTAAVATGIAGRLEGVYKWKVAFANDQGETVPGPATSPLTALAFAVAAAPTSYSTVVNAISRLGVGLNYYTLTNVTSLGETALGSGFLLVTTYAIPAPSTPGLAQTSHGVILPGTYGYKTTFLTRDGESTPSTAGVISVTAYTALTPSSLTSSANGPLLAGTYNYKLTTVTAEGETLPGTLLGITPTNPAAPSAPSYVSATSGGTLINGLTYDWKCSFYSSAFGETPLSGGMGTITISAPNQTVTNNFPAAPAWADGLRMYRKDGTGTFQLVGQFLGFPGGNIFDAGGAYSAQDYPVDSHVVGSRISVTVPTSSEPNVLARRIYRTQKNGSDYYLVGELDNASSFAYLDLIADADLTQRAPLVDSVGRQVTVSSIAVGVTGVTGRRIYRTKVGGSAYFLVGEIRDNSTTSWTDNVPDTDLQVTAPGANTAGSTALNGSNYQPTITVPVGPTGTLARRIYRTAANGADYLLVGEIDDNTTTAWVDNVPDSDLGRRPPLTNGAGAAAVTLSSIPVGATGVTQRVLYRTEAGGSDYKYLATIQDNTSTTFTDNQSDASLGRLPVAITTIGALAGDTSITIVPGPFSSSSTTFPSSGWFLVDNQVIRYTGITGDRLTGIPASGPGSITGPIRGGATIIGSPALTGVSGLTLPLAKGDVLNVWIQRDDLTAQGVRAAIDAANGLVGADGVYEGPPIVDDTLSEAELTALLDANLVLFSYPIVTARYACRDVKTKSGKPITITNILGYSGTLTIQDVNISELGIAYGLAPKFTVTASSIRFSLESIIRRLLAA